MQAVVIGATGLVGKNFVKELLSLPEFDTVTIFVRRSSGITHPKLKEHLVSFDEITNWKDQLKGDILFSALGTTLKVAGSKEAQYKIDHDYQLAAALAAASNGMKTLVLVSSDGASSRSPFFYLKMKGQLEEAVRKLPFHSVIILRPGLLKGERAEKRILEGLSQTILGAIPKGILPSKLSPVPAEKVAHAGIVEAIRNSDKLLILDARTILKFDVATIA